MTQDIKDASGKLVGKRIENGRVTELRDAKGNTVGRYLSNANATYDRSNRKVGDGDQLMRLLPS
jgi:hypothetical protein